MTKDNILNNFEQFLANNFATTEPEWKKYANSLAINFLNPFFDNLDYMNEQMTIFSARKEDVFYSVKEKNKIEIILNVFFLSNMIDINWKEKKITINYDKITKSFIPLTSKQEKEEINENIKEIDLEIKHFKNDNASFSNLYKNYNILIGYIKEEKAREAFFKEFLLKDKKTSLERIANKNLFFQPNI